MSYIEQLEKQNIELQEKLEAYAQINSVISLTVETIYFSNGKDVCEIKFKFSIFDSAYCGDSKTYCSVTPEDGQWMINYRFKELKNESKSCSYEEVITHVIDKLGLSALEYKERKETLAAPEAKSDWGKLTTGTINVASAEQIITYSDAMNTFSVSQPIESEQFKKMDELLTKVNKLLENQEKPIECKPWTLKGILKNLKNAVMRFKKK
jgi:hypothetical protein